MAEGSAIAAPASFEEPYEVSRLERLTPTIIELELHPLGDVLGYLPGEYVLLEDDRHEAPPRSLLGSQRAASRRHDLAAGHARPRR